MILYNVTVSLDPSVEKEWLDFMRLTHIKDVLNTGLFLEARLSKIHGEVEEVTYAISYLLESAEHLDKYSSDHANVLQQDHSSRFGGKFAAFRTTMNVIEEFKI